MRARSHSERVNRVRCFLASPLAFWDMASVRARSHSERSNSLRLRSCEPARILGAEVAFVRARSHSRRAISLKCRPREPARFLGAAEVFVRARPHSVRVNSSLPATASSLSHPKTYLPDCIPLFQDAKKYFLVG